MTDGDRLPGNEALPIELESICLAEAYGPYANGRIHGIKTAPLFTTECTEIEVGRIRIPQLGIGHGKRIEKG